MIAIISYDNPHRKTQDLVTKLMLKGHSNIHLVLIPWVERKSFTPIFTHRPSHRVDISPSEMCERLGLKYSRVEIAGLHSFFQENDFKHIIIGGAGLLPDELVINHKIINGHPGYLPNMKGLDALKWAIYHGEPVGVTTHYVSDKTDEGELIQKKTVPVYFEDTFHNLAYRVYEVEIDMLTDAVGLIDRKEASFESLSDDQYVANKRMPHHYEMIMMSRFDILRRQSPSSREL